MNLLLFFFTFNLVLISRLALTFNDNGIAGRPLLKLAVIPLLSLLILEISAGWFMLLAYLLLYPILMYFLEVKGSDVYGNRLRILMLHLVVLVILFSPAAETELAGYLQPIFDQTVGFQLEILLAVQVYLFGGLLVMNEMNIVLRYLMKVLKLANIGEGKDKNSITAQEYNTGRVIGMLERLFIYTFTIVGQFAAIGFILTAKGVVRYREFKNPTFAEYVLIGTLLSALLAMAVALIVKSLI